MLRADEVVRFLEAVLSLKARTALTTACAPGPPHTRMEWNATISAGFENYIIFVLKNGSKGAMHSRVCTSCNIDWLVRYVCAVYAPLHFGLRAAAM